MKRVMVVMAGGTGGHIFPGIALAEKAKAAGWEVHWIGAEGQMETELVPKYDIVLHLLPVEGLRRRGVRALIRGAWRMIAATFKAIRLFQQLQPATVVGFGGYVSAAGGVAAIVRRIPLVLHEQNAIAGATNRWLSRYATLVAEAFPNTFDRSLPVVTVGNPVRQAIQELPAPVERFAQREGALRILVVGGSRGAKVLNEVVPQALAQLTNKVLMVRHQAGRGNQATTEGAYRPAADIGHQIEVSEFIDDMAGAYAWADLVICRAGALTVSELITAGLGAVLVPYPYAVDDHQTANARHLTEHGAGELLPQNELSATRLASLLSEMTRARCQQMAEQAYRLRPGDAAASLLALIDKKVVAQ
ncbi:MAG: undecaprenyldiphospho-muramoylpentapeptide beta-N-acetylglucosaminyltransferase [Gammaproteobacteria bacterium]|nr:MAG: undecaprenyldiphospho-muramoylpentapeptide beta-N-acetylglucosaminyltransferase [Gammaproteobacteria bacterium]